MNFNPKRLKKGKKKSKLLSCFHGINTKDRIFPRIHIKIQKHNRKFIKNNKFSLNSIKKKERTFQEKKRLLPCSRLKNKEPGRIQLGN